MTQDRGRDVVDGGAGRDNALVDEGRDSLERVEHASPTWPKRQPNPCSF